MKLLIEHPYYNPFTPDSPKGGTERFAHQAFSCLRDAGFDAHIYSPPGSTPLDGVLLGSVPPYSAGDVSRRLVKWYEELNEVASGFDAVILNSSPCGGGFERHMELASKSVSIAHYYHLCRSSQPSFRYALQCKITRKYGGRVVSVGQSFIAASQEMWEKKGEYAKECYPKLWKLIGSDIPQFDGTIDINMCPNSPLPARISNKVVAIGRPVKEKSLFLAAETMAQLPDYERVIYTYDDGGRYFQKLRELCESQGISLVLSAPHSQIMEGISNAKCLLFPSHSETNGIVAFEAASVGVPVIHRCPEPLVFLEQFGLSRKIEDGGDLVDLMLSAVLSESQTFEERLKVSKEIRGLYSEKGLANRLYLEILKLPAFK
jgi:glycosyltransferase involved in cell wall biosynthesis